MEIRTLPGRCRRGPVRSAIPGAQNWFGSAKPTAGPATTFLKEGLQELAREKEQTLGLCPRNFFPARVQYLTEAGPDRRFSTMHSTPPSDGDLVRLMVAGSEDAFGVLYERWSPSVYRFALHMSGDQQIAEEVTQDAFMALVRRPSMFDETRGALVSWLMGVARNLTRRALGASPDDACLDDSVEPAAPSDILSDLTRREMIETVRQAVLSLPPAYREVVVLCDLQEMDYRDAAVALDCPVGTVRSRLHRARTILMTKLQARCFA